MGIAGGSSHDVPKSFYFSETVTGIFYIGGIFGSGGYLIGKLDPLLGGTPRVSSPENS